MAEVAPCAGGVAPPRFMGERFIDTEAAVDAVAERGLYGRPLRERIKQRLADVRSAGGVTAPSHAAHLSPQSCTAIVASKLVAHARPGFPMRRDPVRPPGGSPADAVVNPAAPPPTLPKRRPCPDTVHMRPAKRPAARVATAPEAPDCTSSADADAHGAATASATAAWVAANAHADDASPADPAPPHRVSDTGDDAAASARLHSELDWLEAERGADSVRQAPPPPRRPPATWLELSDDGNAATLPHSGSHVSLRALHHRRGSDSAAEGSKPMPRVVPRTSSAAHSSATMAAASAATSAPGDSLAGTCARFDRATISSMRWAAPPPPQTPLFAAKAPLPLPHPPATQPAAAAAVPPSPHDDDDPFNPFLDAAAPLGLPLVGYCPRASLSASPCAGLSMHSVPDRMASATAPPAVAAAAATFCDLSGIVWNTRDGVAYTSSVSVLAQGWASGRRGRCGTGRAGAVAGARVLRREFAALATDVRDFPSLSN